MTENLTRLTGTTRDMESRRSRSRWLPIAAAALLAVAGCGGGSSGGSSGGDGGDDGYGGGGGGGDDTGTTLEPTLQSIQDNIFTPICTECHTGASAPEGLRLEDGMSYGMLVNVASSQVPELDRVEPGDPDNSYMIRKLEGTNSVGERMPFGGPYLDQADINVIRQWITDGASETAVAKSSQQPATLKAAWPPEDAILDTAPRKIVLIADAELDTTLLHGGSVQLLKSGASGMQVIDADMRITSLSPTVITLEVPQDNWSSGHYEIRVSGNGPAPVASRGGIRIDGDRDGIAGGDFSTRFEIRK